MTDNEIAQWVEREAGSLNLSPSVYLRGARRFREEIVDSVRRMGGVHTEQPVRWPLPADGRIEVTVEVYDERALGDAPELRFAYLTRVPALPSCGDLIGGVTPGSKRRWAGAVNHIKFVVGGPDDGRVTIVVVGDDDLADDVLGR